MEKIIKITNETGLHARPASLLVRKATSFQSDVTIECGDKTANAKSIMNVLSLGLKQGEEIKIITKGSDEKEALESIVALIEKEFEE